MRQKQSLRRLLINLKDDARQLEKTSVFSDTKAYAQGMINAFDIAIVMLDGTVHELIRDLEED